LPHVKGRAAFTLVEILVVLAVIAVLAALAMGGASRGLESAAISKSASQMLQLGRAAHSWAADNNGCLPTAGGPPAMWYEEIYPYIYNTNAPSPFFQPNDKADNLRGTVFWCPLRDRFDEGPNKRSYGWNTYVKDMTKPERPPLAIARVKQPSKTMMLATSMNGSVVNCNKPKEPDTWNLSDRCGDKVLVVFIDGHLEKWAMTNIPSSNTNVFWSPE